MEKKPGYLFVLPWEMHHIGGVNQVVANLYEEMEKDDYFQPYLLVCDWHSRSLEESTEEGRKVLRTRVTPPFDKKHPLKSKVAYLIHQKKEIKALARYINENNIKVINIHYPILSSLIFLEMRKRGLLNAKIIVSLHGKDLIEIIDDKNAFKNISVFFKHCDVITTCSEYLKSIFLNHFPSCEPKSFVLHNGINLALLKDELVTKLETILPKGPYIVNVATYEHKKGQDILLRGFANYIHAHQDTSIRLIFAGRRSQFLKQLIDLADELNISEQVIFLTNLPHPEAIQLIAKAKLFALPSRIEPFGIVLLEAGYCEIPIIANATGGVTEFLKNRETALLLEENSPQKWTEMLHYAFNNPVLLRNMSTQLKNNVQNLHGWNAVYNHLKKLIYEVS